MINRIDLVCLIADSEIDGKCQSFTPYNCDGNPMFCRSCAKQALDAYERKIRSDAIDECIEYFTEHATEVYSHISARDFICDRLEMLKDKKND